MSRNGEAPWATDETRIFRKTARSCIEQEMASSWNQSTAPNSAARSIWKKAADAGLLLPDVPEEFGGGGGTFALEAVVVEELARAGITIGFGIQGVVARYILAYGRDEQKRAWLPRMARGELIAAIGMTEPASGSNLQQIETTARRDGAYYIVNGSKTFITNGSEANIICLAVRTDPRAIGPKALSLLMVETQDLAGYQVGRPLQKIGRHAQDTCELFFTDVRVPTANLLGVAEGRGLFQMMDQLSYERLSIGVSAVATAERAVEITTDYVKDRKTLGRPLLHMQNARFKLAECKTEAQIGRVFIDHCIQRFIDGSLDAVTAAMAKYWLTEMQCRILDECVQLHGGYGYMQEYPIARMWADGRVQRIYGGSNEIMKEIVGGSL